MQGTVMCVSMGGWAPNLCGAQPGQPRTFEPNGYPTNNIGLCMDGEALTCSFLFSSSGPFTIVKYNERMAVTHASCLIGIYPRSMIGFHQAFQC